ncbi:MlaA family lipoprotein [Klebsiella variicola]
MDTRSPAILIIMFLLPGWVITPTAGQKINHSDPFEGFNRAMLNFNVVDPYILRPIAVGWNDYVPQPVRNGLSNFTSHIEEPAVMLNAFLRGDPYKGMVHFTLFFLNTMLGLGGLIDVAGRASPQLQRTEPRRFGSTLAYYGVSYGPYLQLPLYGSFTLRQEGGDMVDNLYPVLYWLTWPGMVGKLAINTIETRAQLLESEGMLRQSTDPYIMVRESYFQHNNFINNGGILPSDDKPLTEPVFENIKGIDAE